MLIKKKTCNLRRKLISNKDDLELLSYLQDTSKAVNYLVKYPLIKNLWRSRGASAGTHLGAQALGAHQYTFCSHLKTRFKQKFGLKYA